MVSWTRAGADSFGELTSDARKKKKKRELLPTDDARIGTVLAIMRGRPDVTFIELFKLSGLSEATLHRVLRTMRTQGWSVREDIHHAASRHSLTPEGHAEATKRCTGGDADQGTTRPDQEGGWHTL